MRLVIKLVCVELARKETLSHKLLKIPEQKYLEIQNTMTEGMNIPTHPPLRHPAFGQSWVLLNKQSSFQKDSEYLPGISGGKECEEVQGFRTGSHTY